MVADCLTQALGMFCLLNLLCGVHFLTWFVCSFGFRCELILTTAHSWTHTPSGSSYMLGKAPSIGVLCLFINVGPDFTLTMFQFIISCM